MSQAKRSDPVTSSRHSKSRYSYSVLTRCSRRWLRISIGVRRPLRWRRRFNVRIKLRFVPWLSLTRLCVHKDTKRWTVIGRASGKGERRCAQRFRGRHAYARWWGRRRHGYGCQKSAAIFFHSCRLLLTVYCIMYMTSCYTLYIDEYPPLMTSDDVLERGSCGHRQRRSKCKWFPAIHSKQQITMPNKTLNCWYQSKKYYLLYIDYYYIYIEIGDWLTS